MSEPSGTSDPAQPESALRQSSSAAASRLAVWWLGFRSCNVLWQAMVWLLALPLPLAAWASTRRGASGRLLWALVAASVLVVIPLPGLIVLPICLAPIAGIRWIFVRRVPEDVRAAAVAARVEQVTYSKSDEAREEKRAGEAARRAAAAEKTRADRERMGPEVASEVFGIQKVTIYKHGYVKVAPVLLGRTTVPKRLVSIEASRDIAKKSGVGRTAGFVVSGGLNMLASNKKGDVYLTIATDTGTQVLHSEDPRQVKTGLKLEAAGRAVLQAQAEGEPARPQASAAPQPPPTPPSPFFPPPAPLPPAGSGVRDRLVEIKALFDEGLITQTEFDERRRSLLEEI